MFFGIPEKKIYMGFCSIYSAITVKMSIIVDFSDFSDIFRSFPSFCGIIQKIWPQNRVPHEILHKNDAFYCNLYGKKRRYTRKILKIRNFRLIRVHRTFIDFSGSNLIAQTILHEILHKKVCPLSTWSEKTFFNSVIIWFIYFCMDIFNINSGNQILSKYCLNLLWVWPYNLILTNSSFFVDTVTTVTSDNIQL